MLAARNRGDKPAILERVSFTRLDPGLKYLGAHVLSQPRHCQTAKIPAPRECLFYSWKDKRGRVHTARRSAGGFIEGFARPRDGHVRGRDCPPRYLPVFGAALLAKGHT
jgi:hypothetical protein